MIHEIFELRGSFRLRCYACFRLLLAVVTGLIFLCVGLADCVEAAESDSYGIRESYLEHLQKKGVVDVRLIHDSGSGPGAFNLVVVSAGFKAEDQDSFFRLCDRLEGALFKTGAWSRYKDAVNIYGVMVDDESIDKTRVQVQGYKGQLLICQNQPAIQFANYAVTSDATVVIHNSNYSIPTCGMWAVCTGNRGTAGDSRTLQHELGHCVGGLGDTYVQRQGPYDGSLGSLWEGKNATDQKNPLLTQWHYWTQDYWPGIYTPLKLPEGSNVVNYEGAAWGKGLYRPEGRCVMCGGDNPTYCTVCNEYMEANFFRSMNFFPEVSPSPGEIVLWKGESLAFRLKALDFICKPPPWLQSELDFYVDGKRVAKSSSGEINFRFGGNMATPGYHQVGANLAVQSERVRRHFGFLSRSRAWRVKVMPCEQPILKLDPIATVQQGETVRVPIRAVHSRPDLLDIRMLNAPEGAQLRNGCFEWRAPAPGAWRVEFIVSIGGQDATTESMEIYVKPSSPVSNALQLKKLEPVDALVGKKAVIQLKADTEGSAHLLYSLLNAPEGMELDRSTGRVVWTPREDQTGPRRLQYQVSNGFTAVKGDVLIGVCAEAVPYPNSCCNDYAKKKLEWLQEVKVSPVLYERFFGIMSMLRERISKLYAPALAEAKIMYAELPPQYRELVLSELARYAWAYVDRPDTLEWMDMIAGRSNSESALKLRSELNDIKFWAKVKDLELNGNPKYVRALVAHMARSNSVGVNSAIRRAVKTFYGQSSDKSAYHRLVLSEIRKSKGQGRGRLLTLLPIVEMPAMEKILIAAAKDDDPYVSRSAILILGEAGALDQIAPLSEVLVSSPEKRQRNLIVQALEKICERGGDQNRVQQAVIEVLNQNSGPGSPDLLQLIPTQKTTALLDTLSELSRSNDSDLSSEAGSLLQYIQKEIGATDAFVSSWIVSGPYLPEKGSGVFDSAFAPEKGEKAEWKSYHCDGSNGPRIVPLNKMFGGDNRAAYIKTVVWSERERKVLFGAGSDDGIKLWLNGKLIHSNPAARALKPDEDKFTGTLKAGENIILCKITQNVLGWGASLSIRAPDGGPAKGVRVVPESEILAHKTGQTVKKT